MFGPGETGYKAAMRYIAALIASAIALVGAIDASGAGRPITQADTGKTFRLKRGGEMSLRLSNRWHWTILAPVRKASS